MEEILESSPILRGNVTRELAEKILEEFGLDEEKFCNMFKYLYTEPGGKISLDVANSLDLLEFYDFPRRYVVYAKLARIIRFEELDPDVVLEGVSDPIKNYFREFTCVYNIAGLNWGCNPGEKGICGNIYEAISRQHLSCILSIAPCINEYINGHKMFSGEKCFYSRDVFMAIKIDNELIIQYFLSANLPLNPSTIYDMIRVSPRRLDYFCYFMKKQELKITEDWIICLIAFVIGDEHTEDIIDYLITTYSKRSWTRVPVALVERVDLLKKYIDNFDDIDKELTWIVSMKCSPESLEYLLSRGHTIGSKFCEYAIHNYSLMLYLLDNGLATIEDYVTTYPGKRELISSLVHRGFRLERISRRDDESRVTILEKYFPSDEPHVWS